MDRGPALAPFLVARRSHSFSLEPDDGRAITAESNQMSDQSNDAGGAAPAGTERSGKFSQDPMFDPAELFEVIAHDDNVHRVLGAMREFIRRNDTSALEHAVAIYVRSARTRGEPVEVVLGTLETVADDLERGGTPGFKQRDTPLRHAVLRGVLLAFYGADAVQREERARRERVERRRLPDDVTG